MIVPETSSSFALSSKFACAATSVIYDSSKKYNDDDRLRKIETAKHRTRSRDEAGRETRRFLENSIAFVRLSVRPYHYSLTSYDECDAPALAVRHSPSSSRPSAGPQASLPVPGWLPGLKVHVRREEGASGRPAILSHVRSVRRVTSHE